MSLVDLSSGSVRKAMRNGHHVTGFVEKEDDYEHVRDIHRFVQNALWEIRTDKRWLGHLTKVIPVWAVEDFVLRGGKVGTTAREGLTPVRRGAGLEVLVKERWFAEDIGRLKGWHYQMPAHAKGFATDERLRLWKLYEIEGKAKPHRRDALRHVALRVSKLVDRTGR